MENHWSVEFGRLALLIFTLIVVSLVTEAWVLSAYVFFISFIIWQTYQLIRLERWIIGDFKNTDALNNSGIWQTLVQHLYRTHRTKNLHVQQLQESVQQYNAMASILPYGVIVLNEALEIEWTNPAATQRLGIHSRDIGQNICNYIRQSDFQDYLHYGKSQDKFKMQSPIDKQTTLIITIVFFGNNQRLLIARDISHRIKMQRSRKLFVANASHELKTPLCVISGYLEILGNTNNFPPAEVQKAIDSSASQAKRMSHIIDDLLLLSILENQPLNKKKCQYIDVNQQLTDFIHVLQLSGDLASHTIETNLDPNLRMFAIDIEFNSLYTNLLSNAVKHTPEGTKIKVSWQSPDQGETAYFIIEDNGLGIDAKHLDHISERFYRVDGYEQNKGTGLGLSIVKHVIHRYKGVLKIESEINKGSKFITCFPKQSIGIIEK